LTENAKKYKTFKTVFDYEKEGKVLIKDEVEDAIINKYQDHKDYAVAHHDDAIIQLKRQAVVDSGLLGKNYPKSVSEQKRVWYGGNGMFDRQDIASWYRLINITGIGKVYNFFRKSHNQYAKLSQLSNKLSRASEKNTVMAQLE